MNLEQEISQYHLKIIGNKNQKEIQKALDYKERIKKFYGLNEKSFIQNYIKHTKSLSNRFKK